MNHIFILYLINSSKSSHLKPNIVVGSLNDTSHTDIFRTLTEPLLDKNTKDLPITSSDTLFSGDTRFGLSSLGLMLAVG